MRKKSSDLTRSWRNPWTARDITKITVCSARTRRRKTPSVTTNGLFLGRTPCLQVLLTWTFFNKAEILLLNVNVYVLWHICTFWTKIYTPNVKAYFVPTVSLILHHQNLQKKRVGYINGSLDSLPVCQAIVVGLKLFAIRTLCTQMIQGSKQLLFMWATSIIFNCMRS